MKTLAPPHRCELTVPLPPNMPNERHGGRTKHRRKKAYWETLNLRRYQGRIGKPPWQGPPQKVRITWRWYVWSALDEDNLYARAKALIDWLVHWDYLRGDAPEHLEYEHPPHQEMDRRNMRVEITIEAIL